MFQIIILLLWLTTVESVAEYPLAKPGCQESCGNIDIPYPFGIGSNCYMADGFAVTCNDSLKPPKLFINSISLEVLKISVNGSTFQVNNPVITSNCSGRADGKDVDLRKTPFTFSNRYNRFTASGCNNLALITDGLTVVTGCKSICNVDSSSEMGSCGISCCQTTIPPLISFFNASLRSLDPNRNQDGCKYAFMVDYEWFRDKNISAARDMEYVPAVLNWAACNGTETNSCGTKAYCRSYKCVCPRGYEGNPYLPRGCQDINECSNTSLNQCGRSFCLNTPGSYDCYCPNGYYLSADYANRTIYANGTRIYSNSDYFYTCRKWYNNGNSRTKVIIIASKASS